jgi:lipoprotein-anchoring transpeptidase ErfK/SrfK
MQVIRWAAVAAALFLGGCAYTKTADPMLSGRDAEFMALSRTAELDKQFDRYEVENTTGEGPGTIVVETRDRLLYYVLPDGKTAMRYGVAIGREGFGWTGETTIGRKAEWPNWIPPAEMMVRWPQVHPTDGGPNNPLGARAMYLYKDGKDTLYRIHGTVDPTKIGRLVSSGCIRMRNIDVIDLYSRVDIGTRVIVR